MFKSIANYFKEIFQGVGTLLKGMRVTGYYFFHARKEIITQQYPETRDSLEMFDRFRGEVLLTHDEKNEHRCTGCSVCEIACPNGSIEIVWDRIVNEEGKKKKTLDKFVYHLSMCTMCGLCIEACPTDAIVWAQNYENSVYDRTTLTKVLNQPGSKVKAGIED